MDEIKKKKNTYLSDSKSSQPKWRSFNISCWFMIHVSFFRKNVFLCVKKKLTMAVSFINHISEEWRKKKLETELTKWTKMKKKENTYLSLRRVSNWNLKNKGKLRDGIDEMDNEKKWKILTYHLEEPNRNLKNEERKL